MPTDPFLGIHVGIVITTEDVPPRTTIIFSSDESYLDHPIVVRYTAAVAVRAVVVADIVRTAELPKFPLIADVVAVVVDDGPKVKLLDVMAP